MTAELAARAGGPAGYGGVEVELLRREHRPSTPDLRPLARRAGVI